VYVQLHFILFYEYGDFHHINLTVIVVVEVFLSVRN